MNALVHINLGRCIYLANYLSIYLYIYMCVYLCHPHIHTHTHKYVWMYANLDIWVYIMNTEEYMHIQQEILNNRELYTFS